MVEINYVGLMIMFGLYCLGVIINSVYLNGSYPRQRDDAKMGGDVFGLIINLVIAIWFGSVLF